MAARKQRFTGLGRSWAPAFLESFRNTLNVRAAAEAAGIGRPTVYQYLKQSEDFRQAFEAARADAVDMLAARALQKALAGESDVLTIYLLKVHGGPEYRNDQRRTSERTLDDAAMRRMVDAIAAEFGVESDGVLEVAERVAKEQWEASTR